MEVDAKGKGSTLFSYKKYKDAKKKNIITKLLIKSFIEMTH